MTACWVSHTIRAISSAIRTQEGRFLSPAQKGRATPMNCFQAARDRVGGRLRRGLSVVGGKGVGSGAAGLAAAGSGMERSEGWRKLHLNDRRSARVAPSAD